MAKNTQNTNTNRTNRTKNDKKKFLKKLGKNNCHISKTCEHLNIGRQTYYDWLDDDKEYSDQVENVREALNDDTEDALITAINNGNITAIIFRLKTKCRDRGYDEHHQITIDKPFNGINLENID